MKNLKFVQLQKDSEEHYKLFESLMIPYNKEIDKHQKRVTSEDFILKVTRGMLNMQGPPDRHLELCYDRKNLVGFLYGKVDHIEHKGYIKPDYGYIMEFYVKPEFRRDGYGKAMFKRLEQLFASHGVKRMYLTADPVTGKLFWTAMGFEATGEMSPENGLEIFEKDVMKQPDIITITIDKYLTNDMAQKIAVAQWHSDKPEWVNRIRECIYSDDYFYDCFCVVAENQSNEILGRLYCIQNEAEKGLWYYGDLFVIPSYRRMGIATNMLRAAKKHLSGINVEKLRCYVDPENAPSIALQKSLGFYELPFENFNNLTNDGQIMFEVELPSLLSVIRATEYEARFITMFYRQNTKALHSTFISLNEFKTMLASNDPDEANFLICYGCTPVAWLKINGLQSKDIAWISMLVVSGKHQHRGIGTYAVQYAEEYIKAKGFSKVGIHTTDDNTPARNLYEKCEYSVMKQNECVMGDGTNHFEFTYVKSI